MNTITFRRALPTFTNPVTLAAIVIMLVNDHILKEVSPSWWTGKISDFAGLVFAPLLLAVPLAILIPRRQLTDARHGQRVGLLAFVLVGLGFSAIKTIPIANDGAVAILKALLGGSVQMVRDPTDLIALPMLLIGWYVWRRAGSSTPFAIRRSWLVHHHTEFCRKSNLWPPLSRLRRGGWGVRLT